jgi:outer membrane protein OmpA-like peptidoglycan-associated protein
VLRGVHFDFNKSFVREVDKPVLDEAAETLKGNPNVKVDVNGYCGRDRWSCLQPEAI